MADYSITPALVDTFLRTVSWSAQPLMQAEYLPLTEHTKANTFCRKKAQKAQK
jgi:hypothetical protein